MITRILNSSWLRRLSIPALLISLPCLAALDTVAGLFEDARYEEARQTLDQGDEVFRTGEATLWQVRLATEPDEALVLLRESLANDHLPAVVRTRMILEVADIEFGLAHYQSCLKTLTPVLGHDQGKLPGALYLRAGLALRAMGNLQKAREMLASVKPLDEAFMLARYYLGDIALEQKDAGLALRYFESVADSRGSAPHPRVAGGQWRAYLVEGREQEASDLEQALRLNDPGSLAMLEIQRLSLELKEELAAMTPVDSLDSKEPDAAEAEQARGRYALQLGAFSDRSLALEFHRRYREQLPDLRIDEVRDERGQFLYKIRTGSFVNPALALTEARSLARQMGMEVIVADLSDATNRID